MMTNYRKESSISLMDNITAYKEHYFNNKGTFLSKLHLTNVCREFT